MNTKKHIQLIAQTLGITEKSVQETINLFEEGATVPFIARYRKERTGGLDEVQILDIKNAASKYSDLEKRRESILKTIEEQGNLSPQLKRKIEATYDATLLEDLYLPYKRKRKTRASMAREKGLEPLANLIFEQRAKDIERQASRYLNDNVENIEAALQGARDIIAERINEDQAAREKIRRHFERSAVVTSRVVRGKKEEGIKYKDYFDYEERLKNCPSHRLLAMRRGEEEGFLRIIITPEEERAVNDLQRAFITGYGEAAEQMQMAVEDAYQRLLSPSIENEFRGLSKDKADEEAIKVFAENLRQLLLAAPLGEKSVLAIDPGYRTGCKVVCLSKQGDLEHNTTIYPHPPQGDVFKAKHIIKDLVKKYNIEAIAIGNGTASRETEQFVKDLGVNASVFVVNENGASIYSASPIAREEFPDADITVRGSVSIGRRLIDPLAELVKIDPKSIGVGQYQHDVNQTALKKTLDSVVESCVNAVGINLNTASKHLLTYVSGLGPKLAENIVLYREENGSFGSRTALKKVPRMGAKSFEQCAGFLRLKNAKNPLDNTAVHPESYAIVKQMAKDLKCTVQQLIDDAPLRKQIRLQDYITDKIGLPTLKDIFKELEKPGLDPRGEAKSFEFTPGIESIGDVKEGMYINGIITNITNFGAFVDIGIKESGLIHVSQMADRYVSNPLDVVKLEQAVYAKVIGIDLQRKRIQLSLK